MKNGDDSPTSSPPTPPSPLPISVGPGNQKYLFSPSPSSSPPFSPAPSSHTSAENLPLLHEEVTTRAKPSVFSLDRQRPEEDLHSEISCLKDLLDWLILKCCSCCSRLVESKNNDSAQELEAFKTTKFVS